MRQEETIAAIATAPGKGGIGVVRVTGEHTQAILSLFLKRSLAPRVATVCDFHDASGLRIDKGIALFFQGPHSFTGEDVLELQGHGGPLVLDMILAEVVRLGARIAEPGEFSKRAFLNNKIDLTQAEAIADLIHAVSREAVFHANRSLQGVFSKQIEAMQEAFLKIRVTLEAALDFPEEEITPLMKEDMLSKMGELLRSLKQIQDNAKQGQLLREGISVAIVGRPNVGKSTLLNQLTQQETAIVSPFAGTTRDLIKETILLEGIPIHVVDTAGIRENAMPIEEEGIRRTFDQFDKGDRIVWVLDKEENEWTEKEKALLERYQDKILWVVNKIDLSKKPSGHHEGKCYLSAQTGEGVEFFKEVLVKESKMGAHEGILLARRRHLVALSQTEAHVLEAERCLASEQWELVAEALKWAHSVLGEIVGKTTTEDLLGEIFSTFCIGK